MRKEKRSEADCRGFEEGDNHVPPWIERQAPLLLSLYGTRYSVGVLSNWMLVGKILKKNH